jgi:hypothetical protein
MTRSEALKVYGREKNKASAGRIMGEFLVFIANIFLPARFWKGIS